MRSLVLLSGGMDSAVALSWATKGFPSDPVDAVTFNYGQRSWQQEIIAAKNVFNWFDLPGRHYFVTIPPTAFASDSSILGRTEVDQYSSAEDAVDNTPHDRSYIPFRNGIFISISIHYLLALSPIGGRIIIGTRGRSDGGAPGFPDCTPQFAKSFTQTASTGAGVPVWVLDPLNAPEANTRAKTILYAKELGCYDVLAYTVSCYNGNRCGKCLPCLRRAQAFAEVGMEDPAQ